MSALFWGRGGFLTGFGNRPMFSGGDPFRLVLGSFYTGFGQQDALGDVLPGDLVAVGVVGAASLAAGAAVAVRAVQGVVTAGA